MNSPFCRPKIADSIVDLVGCTPCVRLSRMAKDYGLVGNVILKLESMEPCKSVKDRIAKSMIEEAEARGDISPGNVTLIEGTSGNTGIGLAMVAAAKGYELIIVMPEVMSMERRVLLKALGAKLILTPADKGIKGVFAKVDEIKLAMGEKGYVMQQFSNPSNPKAHIEGTGPELWYQTDGQLDILVSGVGTGGTMTGCTQFLRQKNPNLITVAVEPEESPVLSGGEPGMHKLQGIGAGFIPQNCDKSLISEVVKVHSETAIGISREIARKEGIFVGLSAGAVIRAAIEVAQRAENADKNIVAIVPSFGERYLSTVLFSHLKDEATAQEIESVKV